MIEALVDQIQQELNMVLISQTDVVKRHHMDRATRQMKELRDIVWKREPFNTQKVDQAELRWCENDHVGRSNAGS